MALAFDDVIISYDLIVFNKAGIKLQGNQSQIWQSLTMIVQCLKNASIFVTSHGQILIDLFQTENSASF